MGVNSLLKTVTRQRRGCDLNPGPSAPESSTLKIDDTVTHKVAHTKSVDNDCYWYCQHSMRSRVYETVESPSVCLSGLSVPSFDRSRGVQRVCY